MSDPTEPRPDHDVYCEACPAADVIADLQSRLQEAQRENHALLVERNTALEKAMNVTVECDTALREAEALRADAERAKAALGLIWSIHVRKEVHLGYERFSGYEQNCIACICALALGESFDGDGGLTAEDFIKKRALLKEGDASKSAGGAG